MTRGHSFREHGPDITLMDLQMPAMTGLEAMAAIWGEFPEAKVIIRTTYAGDVEGALKLAARAHVLKTELDKEVLQTIRAIYSGR